MTNACGYVGIEVGGNSVVGSGGGSLEEGGTGGKDDDSRSSGGANEGGTSNTDSGGSESGGESALAGADMGGESSSGGAANSKGGGGVETGGAGGVETGGGGGVETGGSGGVETGGGGGVETGGSGGVETGGGGGVETGGSGGGPSACDSNSVLCELLESELVHRYSFDGAGTIVFDSVGGQDGLARGTTLDGDGKMTFSGVDDYVDLPSGLAASLPSATFEMWFAWNGGDTWQKLFDLGNVDFLNDPESYLYVTPRAASSQVAQQRLTAGVRQFNDTDRRLHTGTVIQTGVQTHVALVVDLELQELSLYVDGVSAGQRRLALSLEAIGDDIHRLGRSLFSDDPYFDGVIYEYRIYRTALTSETVQQSYLLGPDVELSLTD